jgi:hypothetical protein
VPVINIAQTGFFKWATASGSAGFTANRTVSYKQHAAYVLFARAAFRRIGIAGAGAASTSRRDESTSHGKAVFMHKEDGRIVETAVEARGGPLGRPVLGVLIVSTVLVIGFFALIYIGYFA